MTSQSVIHVITIIDYRVVKTHKRYDRYAVKYRDETLGHEYVHGGAINPPATTQKEARDFIADKVEDMSARRHKDRTKFKLVHSNGSRFG